MTREMTVGELVGQVQLIQDAMRAAMREGEHFGVIPGTQKPTLLKPGAEKLSLLFKLATQYEVAREDFDNHHREYTVTCKLTHQPTGRHIGEGLGSCSTLESKYRYRRGENVCPNCGKAAVIRGKKEYGGGWLCWKKKDGCGSKFGDDEFTTAERVENEDIADVFNTVLKIGKKRAFVDAVLSATAASDIFTQDVEEFAKITPAPAPVPVEEPASSMKLLKDRLHAITEIPEEASLVCAYVSGMRLEEVKTQEDATKVLSGMDAANEDGLRDEVILQSALDEGSEPIPF
jgi:hypothetical protein